MWKRLPTVGAWVMLLALAVANVLLVRQNLQLRAALAKYQPDVLEAGDKLPPFSAKWLTNGEPLQVSYTGQGPKRVFLFFTPSCSYCREQFVYWRELLERADQNRFEIVGLVAESEDAGKVEEYLRSVGCGDGSPAPLRVATIPDDVRRGYRLSSTPITLVTASDGTVEQFWLGRWNNSTVAGANAAFGLNFSSR